MNPNPGTVEDSFKRLRKLYRFTIILVWMGIVPPALAEVQTITATHTYIVGDNDSRNDARQICFLEAKRKVLEKAGGFIQSSSEMQNFQLSKDQISSYSAAVLSVEITKEEFGFYNGHNALTLTVKADVDVADVHRRLSAIIADKSLQSRLADQQKQILKLEQQVREMGARLNMTPSTSALELRKERTVVLDDLRSLEQMKMSAINRLQDEEARRRATIRKIVDYIVKGMTEREVLNILGQPIRTKMERFSGSWIYEGATICFLSDNFREDELRVAAAIPTAYCSFSSIEKDDILRH